MKEPTSLMRKAADRLFEENAGERDRFLAALIHPPCFAPWILWTGDETEKASVAAMPPGFDWLPAFAMRLEPGADPGKHRLHEEGACYCLDFSSIWAASAMLAMESGPERKRVLDVCAAPGGKSIFASLALRPEFLLANEVIGKRLAVLRHNLKTRRIPNAFTQRLDLRELAAAAPEAFDLAIVDAPCSGQSLLAKGIENPGAFHPATVKGNAKRQLGILTSCRCLRGAGGRAAVCDLHLLGTGERTGRREVPGPDARLRSAARSAPERLAFPAGRFSLLPSLSAVGPRRRWIRGPAGQAGKEWRTAPPRRRALIVGIPGRTARRSSGMQPSRDIRV